MAEDRCVRGGKKSRLACKRIGSIEKHLLSSPLSEVIEKPFLGCERSWNLSPESVDKDSQRGFCFARRMESGCGELYGIVNRKGKCVKDNTNELLWIGS